jgi:hypothetical protein
MPEFRIYRLDRDGRISGPADVIECADNQEATIKAMQLVDGHDVELWRGTRLVARFPADDR